MIFLGFLLPLAIYLLILGGLNNREHPVMVPGTWDFAGILFAASGFLLFGGPAILGNFSERARLFWMLGEGPGPAGGDGGALAWWGLTLLYFVTVLAGSAYLLWQHRQYTSVYNIRRDAFERALHEACIQLGGDPSHGGVFVPGLTGQGGTGRRAELEGIKARKYGPLEIDSFGWLRHVSLRWDPAEAELRTLIEGELRRVLQQVPPADYVVSFWMTMLSQALFILIFFGGIAVLALRMFWP